MFKHTHNILLVDDSKSNLIILRELLSEKGYNTIEALSGKEAISVLAFNDIDLILLDVIMPGMNGFEVCQQLKQNEKFKNIPVVFLTALTDLESVEKGFEAGAVDYITKPFKTKEVIARIKNHLELNSYRSNLENLVKLRTNQLERANVELQNEITEKNKLAEELQLHKEQLEDIIKERTSELKESELRFRTIFEKNSSVILIINPENSKIVNANEASLSFYGYSFQQLTEKFIFDLNILPKKDVEKLMIEAKKGKKNHFNFKHKLANGDIRDVEVYSIPLVLDNELRLVSTIYDITEKKQIQNKILNAIIETEEKEKQRFAKDLHDGLGPILSTSKLYLKSLMQNCNNDCQKNNYKIVQKIDEIINEAIVSIKEISNHLSPHLLTNFGFTTALRSIAKKIENTSDIKFKINSNSEERFLQNIETSAYRVVLEMINNTIKYANANLIDIDIKIDSEKLQISYSDNGIGIDLEKIDVFKTGMGLQNIKSRIKSLNGNIEIITKKNCGFKSFFYIPLNQNNN